MNEFKIQYKCGTCSGEKIIVAEDEEQVIKIMHQQLNPDQMLPMAYLKSTVLDAREIRNEKLNIEQQGIFDLIKPEVKFTIQIDEIRLSEVVEQAVIKGIEKVKTDENNKSEQSARNRKYLYSLQELADFLHCSMPTAQRMKNEGRIPYKQTGRKVIYDPDAVLIAMEHVNIRRFKKNKY